MKLLGDRYAPITFAAGFLETDFATVVAADEVWRARLGGHIMRPLRGAFEDLLDKLLPLTGPLSRYVWVRTIGRWTAYFDNSVDGSDPFGPISYLAQQIKCRGVMIQCRPQTTKAEGGISVSIFGPEKMEFLNYLRIVSAINDGGRWRWDISGAVQPFEEVQHYEARRIRDRLTPEMLDRYCRAMGICAFDDAFYSDQGHLVEYGNVNNAVRILTLKQAQEMFGIETS